MYKLQQYTFETKVEEVRPTLFLACRDEVRFEKVYSLLKDAFLGACAMGHSIDIGFNSSSVGSQILNELAAGLRIIMPAFRHTGVEAVTPNM